MLGVAAHGEKAALHLGMQRLHAAIEHLGKAGELGDIEYRIPASASVLRVPPVETSSTPHAASARAKSTSPVLSDTDKRARVIRRM